MSGSEIAISQGSHHPNIARLSDPVKLLREAAGSREDGCLKADYNGLTWHIYFQGSRLRHAASSFQSSATLDYHFRCAGLKNFDATNHCFSQASLESQTQANLQPWIENPMVTWLHDQGQINFLQSHRILENLTKEAIESFLWLTKGHYQWFKSIEDETNTDSKLASGPNLELEDVLGHFQNRMQAWQKFGPLIRSPHQRPYLFSQASDDTCAPGLIKLGKLLKGMSIRQIALALNQDELKVARLLYPYIQRGDLYLHVPQEAYRKLPEIPLTPVKIEPTVKNFKIACVDDSPTILEEMYRFLNHREYEVTKIDDPIKAASILFRLKPDLILMDITMPEINGYKLCSLLRNSVSFRETPIIMVTGRSGLIDKARAKVAGATDYLVKPFTRGGLLSVVEKYIH